MHQKLIRVLRLVWILEFAVGECGGGLGQGPATFAGPLLDVRYEPGLLPIRAFVQANPVFAVFTDDGARRVVELGPAEKIADTGFLPMFAAVAGDIDIGRPRGELLQAHMGRATVKLVSPFAATEKTDIRFYLFAVKLLFGMEIGIAAVFGVAAIVPTMVTEGGSKFSAVTRWKAVEPVSQPVPIIAG